ncbi:MAG: hypothetical protein ACPHQD_17490, partial [Vibrio toranzoniae]|uniref:hypothetical protein n=1 Tax=Vibrio toranzoniae TaxID=1194427 RepID=UPI003C5FED0F
RIFDTLMRPFRAASEVIDAIISPIRNFFSAEGPIAKAFDVIKQAFSMFSEGSQFMKMLSGIGRVIGRLFYPLTLIMTVWDVVKGAIAGFEDEGFVGAIQGGITGLVNGVIGMPLDLLKSVVSWILGKFGFENAEKALDSFSFEDLISRAIDGIFDMFKMVINGFLEAVATLVDAIPIPGTSKAAEAIRGMKFDTNVQERKRLDSQIESAKDVAMNDERQLKNAEDAYKRAKRADVITVNGRKLTGAEKDAYVENKYGKRYTDALEKSTASDEKVAQLEMDRAALDGNKGSGTNVVDASQTNNVSSSSSQPVVGGAPTAWDASDPMMQDAAA